MGAPSPWLPQESVVARYPGTCSFSGGPWPFPLALPAARLSSLSTGSRASRSSPFLPCPAQVRPFSSTPQQSTCHQIQGPMHPITKLNCCQGGLAVSTERPVIPFAKYYSSTED